MAATYAPRIEKIMNSYDVEITITQTVNVRVEANTPEQAEAAAREQVVDGWTCRADQVAGLTVTPVAEPEAA